MKGNKKYQLLNFTNHGLKICLILAVFIHFNVLFCNSELVYAESYLGLSVSCPAPEKLVVTSFKSIDQTITFARKPKIRQSGTDSQVFVTESGSIVLKCFNSATGVYSNTVSKDIIINNPALPVLNITKESGTYILTSNNSTGFCFNVGTVSSPVADYTIKPSIVVDNITYNFFGKTCLAEGDHKISFSVSKTFQNGTAPLQSEIIERFFNVVRTCSDPPSISSLKFNGMEHEEMKENSKILVHINLAKENITITIPKSFENNGDQQMLNFKIFDKSNGNSQFQRYFVEGPSNYGYNVTLMCNEQDTNTTLSMEMTPFGSRCATPSVPSTIDVVILGPISAPKSSLPSNTIIYSKTSINLSCETGNLTVFGYSNSAAQASFEITSTTVLAAKCVDSIGRKSQNTTFTFNFSEKPMVVMNDMPTSLNFDGKASFSLSCYPTGSCNVFYRIIESSDISSFSTLKNDESAYQKGNSATFSKIGVFTFCFYSTRTDNGVSSSKQCITFSIEQDDKFDISWGDCSSSIISYSTEKNGWSQKRNIRIKNPQVSCTATLKSVGTINVFRVVAQNVSSLADISTISTTTAPVTYKERKIPLNLLSGGSKFLTAFATSENAVIAQKFEIVPLYQVVFDWMTFFIVWVLATCVCCCVLLPFGCVSVCGVVILVPASWAVFNSLGIPTAWVGVLATLCCARLNDVKSRQHAAPIRNRYALFDFIDE